MNSLGGLLSVKAIDHRRRLVAAAAATATTATAAGRFGLLGLGNGTAHDGGDEENLQTTTEERTTILMHGSQLL